MNPSVKPISAADFAQRTRKTGKVNVGYLTLQGDKRIVGGALHLLLFKAKPMVAISVQQWSGHIPKQGQRTLEGQRAFLDGVRDELQSSDGVPVMYALEEFPLDVRMGTMREGYRIEGADEVMGRGREADAVNAMLMQHLIGIARRKWQSWDARVSG